jgi:hypothetical protein
LKRKRCRMGFQYLRCLRREGHDGPHRVKGPLGSRFEFTTPASPDPRDADRTYELAKEIECCRHALCPMSRDALDKALAALPPAPSPSRQEDKDG